MSSSLPPVLAAIAQSRDECAARAFSPLHPVLPPPGAELHSKQAAQLAEALKEGKAHEAALLRHARGVQHFLGLSYAELCEEAKRIPERLRAIATVDGRDDFDPERLIDVAQRVFGLEVRGKNRQAQLARVLDARFWRRVLWKRALARRRSCCSSSSAASARTAAPTAAPMPCTCAPRSSGRNSAG